MSDIDKSDSDNLKLLEEKTLALIPIINDYIDDEYRNFLEELITHSEIGLAYEEIVSTLIFLNVKITPEQFEKFKIEEVLNHVSKDLIFKISKQVV
ncbi:MAG: hypothetical protein LLF94_07095 [Chlamydiales bacterium]|nr:hypothetical protein [Chlamydiales bacterium]